MRLALLIACLLCAAVWGVEGAVTDSTADDPNNTYYLRTGRVPPAEAHPMDARLRAISDAFGGGDYERTRELAQALLDATEDPTLRSEATAFIVESYLAQGDFEGGRLAAESVADGDGILRIDAIEAAYERELKRIQHMVAAGEDAADPARAGLLLAEAHERAYRFEEAIEFYEAVVSAHPMQPEASAALWGLTRVCRRCGRVEDALVACREAAYRSPNSPFIAETATERIAALSFARDRGREAASDLRQLPRRFPNTWISAWARYYLADLHWRSDRVDAAVLEWQALRALEAYGPEIPGLLDRLAEGYSRAGEQALGRGEFGHALVQFSFLSNMPETAWRERHVLPRTLILDRAECHLGLEHWHTALHLVSQAPGLRGQPDDPARALYLEGCARWYLGEYDQAVRAWQSAVSDYPGTEYANRSQEMMQP